MIRKLDLRTGRPVWTAYRAPTAPTQKLTRDVKADVLVVGMGVSGAMVAEVLTEAGFSVIAIDRRGPVLGSTPATTALVQFELDVPLTLLVAKVGKAKAERAWQRSKLAVGNLQAHIEQLDLSCDMVPRRSLYLAGNVLAGTALREEAEARRAAGIHAAYLTVAELGEEYGFKRAGAVASHGNLALNPRKLTFGLLRKALERKARLYSPVEAVAFEHGKDSVQVATKEGPVISAGHVVLATGYELTAIVPAGGHKVISTWAIATRPQKRNLWPHEAMIWEASDPYLYLRTTMDGRVICGGEDEDFQDEAARDLLSGKKALAIAAKLKKLAPALDVEPDFIWAGAFGTTATGLPIIGALPQRPRIHAVMGYGGNGITFSRLAAELVATALTGGQDSDADLFGF